MDKNVNREIRNAIKIGGSIRIFLNSKSFNKGRCSIRCQLSKKKSSIWSYFGMLKKEIKKFIVHNDIIVN
nr:hypothetical protein [Bacillus paranthracis]